MTAQFLAVWEFQVKPESAAEFESIYSSDGEWARLFRRSGEFLGTDLIKDLDRGGRYITIDRWRSREALVRFKREHSAEYSALDKRCERLTEAEQLIGNFEAAVSR